jgi:hypothetical protein
VLKGRFEDVVEAGIPRVVNRLVGVPEQMVISGSERLIRYESKKKPVPINPPNPVYQPHFIPGDEFGPKGPPTGRTQLILGPILMGVAALPFAYGGLFFLLGSAFDDDSDLEIIGLALIGAGAACESVGIALLANGKKKRRLRRQWLMMKGNSLSFNISF